MPIAFLGDNAFEGSPQGGAKAPGYGGAAPMSTDEPSRAPCPSSSNVEVPPAEPQARAERGSRRGLDLFLGHFRTQHTVHRASMLLALSEFPFYVTTRI